MNSASLPFPTEAKPLSLMPGALPGDVAAGADGWPVSLLGVPFDNVGAATALASIAAMIASRRPHFVVTANAGLLRLAQQDTNFRRTIIGADLVLCESRLLGWCSRWLGNPLRRYIGSRDLAQGVLRLAAAHRYRLFFLEGPDGKSEALLPSLGRVHPGLEIAGHARLPAEPGGSDVVQQVRAARSDIVIAHMEKDEHERWLAQSARDFGAAVCIRLSRPLHRLVRLRRPKSEPGASLGAASGKLREHLMAWQQRSRTTTVVLSALLRDWWCMSHRAPPQPQPPRLVHATPEWLHLDAGEDLAHPALRAHSAFWFGLRPHPTDCALDTSKVRRIDATGLAFLVQWRKALQHSGCELFLVAPSPPLSQALAHTGLAAIFPAAPNVAQLPTRAAAARAARDPVQAGIMRSLAWCGEIIAANVDDVWQMTSEYVRTFAASGATLVIIDLSRLRYIDHEGTTLMLRVKKWAHELRTEVLFAHPQEPVVRTLRQNDVELFLLEGGQ